MAQCAALNSTLVAYMTRCLQARGIKLNPVTTLYYIAPACFLFLCFPFTFIEAPKLFAATDLQVPYGLISLSCVAALGEWPALAGDAVSCRATFLRHVRHAGKQSYPRGSNGLRCFPAAALNMSVFLLIGRSSALTMNIAGVIKVTLA